MALQLRSRRLGYEKKLEKFFVSSPRKSFCNIGHDRNSSSLRLIRKAKISSKPAGATNAINPINNPSGFLSAFQVFEAGQLHEVFLVCLVHLVHLVHLVALVCFVYLVDLVGDECYFQVLKYSSRFFISPEVKEKWSLISRRSSTPIVN